jgi:hypothetical protein
LGPSLEMIHPSFGGSVQQLVSNDFADQLAVARPGRVTSANYNEIGTKIRQEQGMGHNAVVAFPIGCEDISASRSMDDPSGLIEGVELIGVGSR